MNAYNAPEPYALPKAQSQQPFHRQLLVQLQRHKILVERNWVSKLLDSILIIGAVVLFTWLEGTVELTKDYAPRVPFDVLAFNPENGLTGQLTTMISRDEMFSMFGFVLGQYYNVSIFGFKLGLILSILIGLTATKILTERRLEFFREAGSGYNVNAYFLSVNIVSTIEHSVQCVLAGAISLWIRGSAAGKANFYVTFLMLGWLCVSSALFLPLIVPSKNVTVVTGFFMAFLGLLLSGIAEPVLYETIYDNAVVAIFSGFFSPIRFFIESLAVGEYRCLPVQSGFTNHGENFPLEFSSFELLGLAGNDDGVNNQSCDGWYWGVLPALMVGLTVRFVALGTIHVSGRSKQAKKSLRETVGNRKGNDIVFTIVGFFALLGILIGVTSWLLLRIVE